MPSSFSAAQLFLFLISGFVRDSNISSESFVYAVHYLAEHLTVSRRVFNIIDTYKVVYALKTTKEQEEITKKQEQKNREIKEYLEFVQRDIDNLLNKSEEQINEAKEITNNIINMDYSNCANAAPSHHQLSSAAGNWEIKNGRLIKIE